MIDANDPEFVASQKLGAKANVKALARVLPSKFEVTVGVRLVCENVLTLV